MSLTTAALRELVAMGLTAEQILVVAEANEAPEAGRTQRQERNRRYYEKRRASENRLIKTTEQDAVSTSLPLPPSPQTPQPPTPAHGEQSRARKGRPEKPTPDITERVWQAASKPSRDRSGRPALAKAVLAAIRAGATDDALIASVREHCRAQGEFAKGVDRIVTGEHWRDHIAANDTPSPAAADPRVLAARLARYRDTGVWEPGWGERPPDEARQPGAAA